jgi:hypothetical protein
MPKFRSDTETEHAVIQCGAYSGTGKIQTTFNTGKVEGMNCRVCLGIGKVLVDNP